MAASKSNMTVLLQNDTLNSLWIPSSSPPFPGSRSMVMSFEKAGNGAAAKEENADEEEVEEDYDGVCFHAPAKKRRLTAKQVEYLEKSFESENKLEPERKSSLAAELGLQPRQVAIWFQNRRARFKTKQLEKDFAVLRASFDALKSDYDDLLKRNHALKLEANSLEEKLVGKERGINSSEGLELENGISSTSSSLEEPRNPVVSDVPNLACKQEDASSAKSDVLDSDESPHCADNNSSSHPFEPELSDFSQDEDEGLIMKRSEFSPLPQFLPKLEDCCYDDPPGSSYHLGLFAVEDDQPFNFWTY